MVAFFGGVRAAARGALSRERNGSRPGEGAGQLGEVGQVGVKRGISGRALGPTDHEPVGHADHVRLIDDRVPIPLVERDVLLLISLQIPGLAADVEPAAVLIHDLAADSATLEMWVNR